MKIPAALTWQQIKTFAWFFGINAEHAFVLPCAPPHDKPPPLNSAKLERCFNLEKALGAFHDVDVDNAYDGDVESDGDHKLGAWKS